MIAKYNCDGCYKFLPGTDLKPVTFKTKDSQFRAMLLCASCQEPSALEKLKAWFQK